MYKVHIHVLDTQAIVRGKCLYKEGFFYSTSKVTFYQHNYQLLFTAVRCLCLAIPSFSVKFLSASYYNAMLQGNMCLTTRCAYTGV